jgi:hypothetical protein
MKGARFITGFNLFAETSVTLKQFAGQGFLLSRSSNVRQGFGISSQPLPVLHGLKCPQRFDSHTRSSAIAAILEGLQ